MGLLDRLGTQYHWDNEGYAGYDDFLAGLWANHNRRYLDRGDIEELEPNLKFPFQRGLLFDSISHVLDPLALSQRYFECFQQNEGQYLRQRALDLGFSARRVVPRPEGIAEVVVGRGGGEVVVAVDLFVDGEKIGRASCRDRG